MWSRNQFGLGLAALCLSLPFRVDGAPIEGYPTNMSVPQGGTLELHVRSELPNYSLSIWRQGRELERIANCGVYTGENFPIPAQAWEGCDWPVATSVDVPLDWRPGAYVARLDAGSSFTCVPFVVRPLHPGTYGPILVQLSTNTWQAYNRYGGKSLYGAFAAGLVDRAHVVSYHRPYNYFATDGSGQFYLWEAPFLAWLEQQGYAYEVCTSLDLHRIPCLLDSYRTFVSVGHDEYYSKEMFDELERYVNAGGNLVFLSGNTLWWQVRFEGDGNSMVCYKDYRLDPLTGIDNARVTVNWATPLVNRPPARLMGLYYNGSWGVPVGAYRVVNPHHWVFSGALVDSGQAFGYPMVGFEVDARTADSPAALDLIARVELPDANNGNVLRPCDMVYYERTPAYGFPQGSGGKVFASGSVNYVQGLVRYYNGWSRSTGAPDPVATTVTMNVLDRLGCVLSPPEPTSPLEMQVVTGINVMLQWRPAAAQRPGIAVVYRVYWQVNGGGLDSLDTNAMQTWLPIRADSSTCRWWVCATSACGVTASSSARSFVAKLPTDTLAGATPPLLVVTEHDRVLFWLSTSVAALGNIVVYDVAGRSVRDFSALALPAGRTCLTWDLRASSGQRVSTGIYFVRAHIGQSTASARVLIRHSR